MLLNGVESRMKLAMIRTGEANAATTPHLALVEEDRVLDVTVLAEGAGWAASVLALIEGGQQALAQLRAVVSSAPADAWRPLDSVRFLAPIPRPPKNVFCVGKNYMEHIAEGQRVWSELGGRPSAPVVFTKAHTAIIGPGDVIRKPANTTSLDYEGELAVVIGKGGRGIAADKAPEHVFGYMLLNDVTARDLQKRGPQWFLGKSCDTFCPTGPWIALADPAVPQPDFEIRVNVNGEERQRFRTSEMLFTIAEIIEEISRNITLEPGDIIATGTGPGCGFALDPPRFLQVGDTVVVEAEGLGRLANTVGE